MLRWTQPVYAALLLLTWTAQSVAQPYGGSAGSGGSGGSNSGTSGTIGSPCEADVDCEAAGLICLTAASQVLGGYGPPGGYCSASCAEAAHCQSWDPGALCWRGYCTCEEILEIPANCFPSCDQDSECGEGLVCDAQTRLCASPPVDHVVGGGCGSDSDCGAPPLYCLREVNGHGLAGGMCTLLCSSDADCMGHDWTSRCDYELGSCVQTCRPIRGVLPEPDESLCGDREDFACDGTWCRPQCANDDQCDGGHACNRGTGLCQPQPTGESAPDATCDPLAEQNTCRGTCLSDPPKCVEYCVLGRAGQCPPLDERRPMACMGITDGGLRTGDRGECTALCNCSDDCAEGAGLVCIPNDFSVHFGAPGICAPAALALVELSDCSLTVASNGCHNGPTRACHCDDGRLGVGACSEDHSGYDPCVCPDEPAGEGGGAGERASAGGAAGDAADQSMGGGSSTAGTARRRYAGCQCQSGPVPGWPAVAWLSLPILQLARYRRRERFR